MVGMDVVVGDGVGVVGTGIGNHMCRLVYESYRVGCHVCSSSRDGFLLKGLCQCIV